MTPAFHRTFNRLAPHDPPALGDSDWEEEAMDLLLQDKPVTLAKAVSLLE